MSADHWRIDVEDLASPRRYIAIVRARQIAMYVIRIVRKCSLPSISRWFGGKDHTTVLHAVRTIEHMRCTDPFVGACVEDIFRSIGFDEDGASADLKAA